MNPLEILEDYADNSEGEVIPQPVAEPAPAAPPKRQRFKAAPQVADSAPISSAEAVKEADAIFKELGLDPNAKTDEPAVPEIQAEASGFWSVVGDTLSASTIDLTKGVVQFSQNISNVSKEAFETVYNKFAEDKIKLETRRKFAPVETGQGQVARKVGELGTPAIIGGAIGSVGGPIGAAFGGLVGGMVGAFIQDPDDANLSTAVQGTKYENLPILASVFDRLAHRPGDSDLAKRYKNMVEDGLMGVSVGGIFEAGAYALKRTGQAAKAVVDDVKSYKLSKKPMVDQAKEMKFEKPQSQFLDEETLAAKEASYSKAGQDEAAAFVEQIKSTEQAAAAPTVAKSEMEVLGELEDAVKIKQEAEALDTFKKSENMQPLTDIDDPTIAAIKHVPEVQEQFVKAVDEAMPIQLLPFTSRGLNDVARLPIEKRAEALELLEGRIKNSLADDSINLDTQFELENALEEIARYKKEGFKTKNEIRVTLTDDSVVENLDIVATKASSYYQSQRAAAEAVEYDKVMAEAATKNATPGEMQRFLTDLKYQDPMYNMNAVEAAQVKMFYMDTLNDFNELTTKVIGGSANDAELAAYAIAKENVGKLGNIMDSAGTGTAHALGIRGMLKKYAEAGNPVAIELIGVEGQAKAIREVIKSFGGKKALQDEAKLFAEFVEQAQRPSGTRNSIGGFDRQTVEQAADKISKIRKSNYNEYMMDAYGEIQRKSRGRRIVDSINSYFFDNMINSLTTVAQTSSVVFDAGLNAANNYTFALLAGLRGKGLEAAARFSKANTYSTYLAKEIKNGLRLGMKEFFTPQGQGDIIVNSGAQVPEYLKNHVLANSKSIGKQAAQEADGIRGFINQVRPYTLGLGRKLLASSDAVTSHLGYRAHVAAHYSEAGYKLGLRGQQLDDYVKEMSVRPSPEVHDQGLLAGAKFAYRADLEIGWMGTIEEGLNRHPISKLFMPFYRTYGNTVERTFEYFPGLAFSLKSSRENIEQSIAKQLTGLGALSYLASEFLDGNITFPDASGGWTFKNFIEVDENNQPTGAMPMSVKTKNGYVQLPIGGAFEKLTKAAGYLAMASKYMDQDELDASLFAATFALTDIMAVNDQYRAVGGLVEFFDDIRKGDDEALSKFASRFTADLAVRAVPFYRLGQEINRDMESVELTNRFGGQTGIDYFLDTMENRLKKVIPGASADVPPMYNALGEPVPAFKRGAIGVHGFMLTTNNKSSEVMQALVDFAEYAKRYKDGEVAAVTVKPIPGTLKTESGTVKLNAKQIAKYSSLFGGIDPASGEIVSSNGMTLRDTLDTVLKDIKKEYKNIDKRTISPEEFNLAAGRLNEVITEFRREATERMQNDPEIIEAVNKLKEIKDRPQSQPTLKLIGNILGAQ
jgi:hypothetical protein